MRILKRLGLFIAVPLLGVSIILGVSLWSLQQHFGESTQLKVWLIESGTYPALQAELIAQTKKAAAENLQQNGASIDETIATRALERAVSTEFLQSNIERALDGTYSWLQGNTSVPDTRLEVAAAKQNFAESISASATERLNTLPDCVVPGQITTTDPFQVRCNPPAPLRAEILKTIKQDIVADQSFLPDNAEIDQLFSSNETGETTTSPPVTPWYQQVSSLPTVFQWAQTGPLVFLMTGLLAIVTIVFCSTSRRNGVRRAATTVLVTSVTLALSSLVILFIARSIKQVGEGAGNLQAPLVTLFQLVTNAIGRWQLVTCVVLCVLSAAVLIYLRTTRPKAKTPVAEAAINTTAATPDTEQAE